MSKALDSRMFKALDSRRMRQPLGPRPEFTHFRCRMACLMMTRMDCTEQTS